MIKKIISSLHATDNVVIEFAVKVGIPLLDTYRPQLVKNSIKDSDRYSEMRKNQLRHLCGDKLSYDIIYWDFFWRDRRFFNTDGTLILSDGRNTERSDYLCYMADENSKPVLDINIIKTSESGAESEINKWIASHDIELLNVSCPDTDQNFGRKNKVQSKIWNVLKLIPFIALSEQDKKFEKNISSAPYILDDWIIVYKGFFIVARPMHGMIPPRLSTCGCIYSVDAFPFKGKWFTNESERFKQSYEANIATFAFGMQIVDGTVNSFEVD